jgi:hypothetical protein
MHRMQGCQMVYFQTENTNLGKFWGALEWKRFVYYSTYVWPFVIHMYIYYGHLEYYIAIWQFSGNLVQFSPVLVNCVKKIWQS